MILWKEDNTQHLKQYKMILYAHIAIKLAFIYFETFTNKLKNLNKS